ncbi:MAG: hypothetical protein ABI760_15860 [Ferruginibacter sp.]
MARSIKKTEAAVVQVNNISPAAMKVILAKINATTNPGITHGSEAFVKGPTNFAQSDGFAKFSRPGESTPIASIEGGGGFKINAENVKTMKF